MIRINLIVIRSEFPKELSIFYEKFGFIFLYHKHGNGPYHYSTSIDNTTLEIYPLLKSQKEIDKGLRIGFELQDVTLLQNILSDEDVEVIKNLELTEWGERCIISDIEGRKIEIIMKK